MDIKIKQLPENEVAFIRCTGSYFEPQEHWGRLVNWAMNNGLFPPQQFFIGISLDNPDVVESRNCRHDACITLPEGFQTDKHKEIEFKTLDGGLYAMYSFYDVPERLNAAYQYVFRKWLPQSIYQADYDRHNLEFNLNNPAEDPEGKCKVNLYVPIKQGSEC